MEKSLQKRNFDKLMIAVAGSLQIYVSLYSIFRILLYGVRYLIHTTDKFEQNYLVTFIIVIYSIHLLYSGILLLKLKNYARILSISNMFGLICISVIGIIMFGVKNPHVVSFAIIVSCLAIYSMYFLTRPRVKEQFK